MVISPQGVTLGYELLPFQGVTGIEPPFLSLKPMNIGLGDIYTNL